MRCRVRGARKKSTVSPLRSCALVLFARAGGALISRWATEPIWRLEIDRGAVDPTGTITRRLNHRRNFLSIRSI